MNYKKEKLLNLLKLEYKNYPISTVLKNIIIDTKTIVLVNDIITDTIIKRLTGQIPEIISIDSIVSIDFMSYNLVHSLTTLSYYKKWNLKPIYVQNQIIHGKIIQDDNAIIINAILDGYNTLNCIKVLKRYKINIIDIVSLIDPENGSREILVKEGLQPISIYNKSNLDRTL